MATVLLDPVPDALWHGARRLVVVPDGPLHFLPFELLAALGRLWTIAYVPSATTLATLRAARREAAWSHQYVGFGAPVVRRAEDALPAGGDEVVAAARAFGEPDHAFTGPDATELNVRRSVAGARVVHFATHTAIDNERPLYSGLLLSPPTAAQVAQDPNLDDRLRESVGVDDDTRAVFAQRLSAVQPNAPAGAVLLGCSSDCRPRSCRRRRREPALSGRRG